MGDALPHANGVVAAKVYYATVYLKHRSLQNRKVKYRGWHLPSAGKSMMVDDDSQEFKSVFKAPVNGSSNYNCSMVAKFLVGWVPTRTKGRMT